MHVPSRFPRYSRDNEDFLRLLLHVGQIALLWMGVLFAAALLVLAFMVGALIQHASQFIQHADAGLTDSLAQFSQGILTTDEAIQGIGDSVMYGVLPRVADTVTHAGDLMGAIQHGPVVGLNATIATINRPCAPPTPLIHGTPTQPCGTLAEMAKTLDTLRHTSGEVELGIHHENKQLDVLNAQEVELFTDAHTALTGLSDDVALSHDTLSQANKLLADPRVDALLTHTSGISGSFDHILNTGDRVMTKATRHYLNPSHNPFARAWDFTEPLLYPGAQIAAPFLK